ncbi:MAG: hypothetical protein KGS61_06385 [Verrucomicrobia bacterium]|nr:hypothetical protein [Verrucomicrobiota bacterium]
MKRCLALLAALWLTAPSLLAYTSPDDEYIRIYNLIMQADGLAQNGQPIAAYQQYQAAQEGLKNLRKNSPAWNEKVVDFRLRYVAEKMAEVATKVPPGALPGSAPPPGTPAKVVSAEELQKQVQSLQAELQRVDGERTRLAAKLKEALSAQPAAVDPRALARAEADARALQKANDLLKVELEQLKAKPAEQRLEALQAENQVLKRQVAARQTNASGSTAHSPTPARLSQQAAAQDAELASLQREKTALEQQLLEARKLSEANAQRLAALQQKLTAASKKTGRRRRSELAAEDRLAEEEIAVLRARLAVLEARKVPYTSQELALFKGTKGAEAAAGGATASPALQAEVKPTPKPAHEPPAEARPLLAEARRLFNAGRYAESETNYEQALRLDEHDAFVLANLASVQLQMGKLTAAEANTKRALAEAPNDGFALYVLGALRYRQDRYDEALDALSRSAKLEPDQAFTENLLGAVLIQKGLRDQAETAFRKAVQLFPDYTEAHMNLARIYALHQPPLRALARFHYQKALDTGAAKDPGLEKFFAENAVGAEAK